MLIPLAGRNPEPTNPDGNPEPDGYPWLDWYCWSDGYLWPDWFPWLGVKVGLAGDPWLVGYCRVAWESWESWGACGV